MNTVEAATSGYSYGSTLAYLWFRPTYLAGRGCGSSYVAELFHDGGLLELCIGSAILSFLMLYIFRRMGSDRYGSIYRTAFSLIIFKGLILIPRTNSFSWLTSAISVQNLMVFVVLLIANQLFSLHIRKEEKL